MKKPTRRRPTAVKKHEADSPCNGRPTGLRSAGRLKAFGITEDVEVDVRGRNRSSERLCVTQYCARRATEPKSLIRSPQCCTGARQYGGRFSVSTSTASCMLDTRASKGIGWDVEGTDLPAQDSRI